MLSLISISSFGYAQNQIFIEFQDYFAIVLNFEEFNPKTEFFFFFYFLTFDQNYFIVKNLLISFEIHLLNS